jgi:hypothetical protein
MHVQAQSWVLPNVFDVGNAVKQLTWTRMTGSRRDRHFIANFYLPEWAKESVTVARDRHISRLPRQGRAWNMSETDAKSLRPDPLQNS